MIEILNYERVNKGKVIGYVDIKLPKWGIILRKIAHLQDGSKKWFNLPSLKREYVDGNEEYLHYFEFAVAVHNSQFLEALTEPVKEYCLKHKIADIEPLDLNKEMNVGGALPF